MTQSRRVRSPRRAPAARITAKQSLGPWHLTECIGEGEWTHVYRARPRDAGASGSSDYVLKTLKPEIRNDPLAISLLQREVLVANQVRHVHLASVLSHHVWRPPHYVVAPFLEGATLRDALRHAGRLSVPYALWMARQTAEALQVLHQNGWRHSDIKPENLLVAPNGHLTLLDLGLAESIQGGAQPEFLRGSPAYAAPEVFHEVVRCSGFSDVYSLGVTLFECLTGRLPFVGENLAALAAAHLREPPPEPRRFVPALPPRLSRLLRRMLAKEPLRRPDIDELIGWLADLEIDTLDDRASA